MEHFFNKVGCKGGQFVKEKKIKGLAYSFLPT